jgi:hypothetical protein
MGIEYIAREPLPVLNHGVASADGRCVRFMCEKQPHTSQRQPMRPFLTVLTPAGRSPADRQRNAADTHSAKCSHPNVLHIIGLTAATAMTALLATILIRWGRPLDQ